jgi:hypothetical protein
MLKSCRVTIADMNGISHTVTVTAETLYEAVALGVASIRHKDWVAGREQVFNCVEVSVSEIPIKHTVRLKDFNAWLEREGGMPKDIIHRKKIRQILGLPISRISV